MKELVVVVHGVGVKKAGVCSDLLSANLKSGNYKPVSSDDFQIREDVQYAKRGKYKVFPSRVRRFTRTNPKSSADELVVADFYWGDLSRIGTGIVGLVYAFVTLILGLAHPLRENAQYVYSGSKSNRFLITLFVHLVHGPIVAVNLILLGGMAIAAGMSKYWPWQNTETATIFVFVAAGLFCGGLILHFGKIAFLSRLLAKWMIATTVLVFLFWIVDTFSDANRIKWAFSSFDHRLREFLCESASFGTPYQVNSGCMVKLEGIYLYGARVLGLSILPWVLTLLIAVRMILPRLKNLFAHDPDSRDIVAETISLMLLLWLLLIGTTWAVFGKIGIVEESLWVENSLKYLPFVLIGLFMVSAAAMWNQWRKSSYVASMEKKFENSLNEKKEDTESPYLLSGKSWTMESLLSEGIKYRLIVNGGIQYMLFFGLTVVTLYQLFFVLLHLLYFIGFNTSAWIERMLVPTDYMEDGVYIVLSGLAVLGTVLTGVLSVYVKGGLEILKDIITYINNQKSFDFRLSEKEEEDGYYLRKQMQDRLKSLVDYFIDLENPDIIKFVSHSQGTVITIDTIDLHGSSWRTSGRPKNRPRKLHLATMGSPYTHIYHHYFPSSFEAVADRKNLRSTETKPAKDKGLLDTWINIFRTDDFVGTYVDPNYEWPKEYCIGLNGHTNYWVDARVGEILRYKNKEVSIKDVAKK